MKSKSKVFTDQKGDTFLVRIIEKDEHYGANVLAIGFKDGNEYLVHDAAATWDSEKPGVIFYDFEYAEFKSFGPRGQQVSTYFVETMLEGGPTVWDRGLCLQGGITKWTIDGATMKTIRGWLNVQVDTEPAWKEWGPQ